MLICCERGYLDKSFLTARLLTGSIAGAEEAVLEGIESWVPETGRRTLLERVACAAVRGWAHAKPDGREPFDHMLAPELQAVVNLPHNLRRCYILRILARIPVEVCGRILRMQPEDVDEDTCEALQRLAAIRQKAVA